jgi:hypothetical protein
MLLFLGKEIQTKDQGSHVLLLSGFVLCRFGYIMQQDVRASPRVCQNLLGKSCVLPTSKKLCKVKKEFISNSLA